MFVNVPVFKLCWALSKKRTKQKGATDRERELVVVVFTDQG